MATRYSPNHYFSRQPTSPSNPRRIVGVFQDRQFVFETDANVFSHCALDRGTRLLIDHLPLPMRGKILDWGTGYGPIGIVVAAFSPEAQVTMVEINERAAELARRNAELNQVRNVEVLCGDAFQVLGPQRFDTVLSNPPTHTGKAVVMALIEDVYERLSGQGQLWMVVRTRAGAKSYQARLSTLFTHVERVAMRGGYRLFRAVRDGSSGPSDGGC
ncbi:MAG: class I SAM-dependent methyltransferase [Candidatus Zipacnadales bacterium]